MSDVTGGHLRYHEIDIPARFIRQAIEHIDHTQARYVTFLFTGENTEDAVCVGVTTRLMIADHRPRQARVQPQPDAEPAPEPSAKERKSSKSKRLSKSKVTLKEITDEVVLAVIRKAPSSTAEIADALGIPTSEVPARQKVWRTVTKLHAAQLLRREGDARQRNHKWSVVDGAEITNEPRMPFRTKKRSHTRQQISEEMVLDHMRDGKLTSKSVSDAIGIPRGDASMRGRVTEHIRNLQTKGLIRRTGETSGGGPVYELHDESSMATAG